MQEFIPDGEFIPGMFISSRKMADICMLIERYAQSVFPVLITGESGVGKELVAKSLHLRSNRHRKEFVPVNCANVNDALFESELFGHEKGSFTGAITRKQGLIEIAHGGTLFLDEIAELPLHLQAKLLRILEDHYLRRVGGIETLFIDFRLVCATNKNLENLVAQGLFREDLYYRICTLPIHVPALRERKDDIRVLAQYFIFRNVGHDKSLSEDAIRALKRHNWPGNIRELKNVIKRAIVLSRGNEITEEDIIVGPKIRDIETVFDTLAGENLTMDDVRQGYMEAVIKKVGSKSGASKVLNISTRTVRHHTNDKKPPS